MATTNTSDTGERRTQTKRWRAVGIVVAAIAFAAGTALGNGSWVLFGVGVSLGIMLAHNDIYQPDTDSEGDS